MQSHPFTLTPKSVHLKTADNAYVLEKGFRCIFDIHIYCKFIY